MKEVFIYKLALFMVLFFLVQTSNAQVTIGLAEKPLDGVLLQLKDKEELIDGGTNASKGFGLPRVALQKPVLLEPCAITDASTKPVYKGLTVYNTTDESGFTPGVYEWNGEVWQPLDGSGRINLGPWYKVGTTTPSLFNTDDSYLNAKVVIGGPAIINNSTLTVLGNSFLDGNFNVAKSAFISNGLSVAGATTIDGETFIRDDLTVGTTASNKNMSVFGTLDVSKEVVLEGNTTIANTLSVQDNTTLKKATHVTGDMTIGETATKRLLTNYGTTVATQRLTVNSGVSSFHSATIGGDAYVYAGIQVSSAGTVLENAANYGAFLWNRFTPGMGATEFLNAAGLGGGTAFNFYSYRGGGYLLSNRIASIAKSGIFSATSDVRVKTQIESIQYGLSHILKLKPVEYDFHINHKFENGVVVLSDEFTHDVGFIAQEVEEIIPHVVTKPVAEDDLYSLSYEKFVPILVKALQEQQGIIQNQNDKLLLLDKKLQVLETKH